MPNPLHTITNVFKDHFTTEDKDVYIDTIKLLDYVATELDKFDYETDGEGEQLLKDLKDSVEDYIKSLREDEDAEPTDDDDDDDKERNLEDLEDDDDTPPITEASNTDKVT